jgi:uncharacterized protein
MSKLTEFVRGEVIGRLNDSQQSVAHRFDHLERVMQNALAIAATVEGVDFEILELAVLLHDVDQPSGRKSEHVELSMHAAEEILRQGNCPEDRVKQVLKVIAEHSTEHVRTIQPSTNEARILFDADKLDGFGAVGISRVFALFGQMDLAPHAAIKWYRAKMNVALEYIQTDEGRRLCELRVPYVEEFLKRLESESMPSADVWSS